MPKLKPKEMKTVWKVAIVVSASMAIFMWATSLAAQQPLSDWEQSLFYWIYGWPYFLTPFFLLVTQLGSYWMLVAVTLAAWFAGKRRLALFTVLTGAVVYSVIQVGKTLIGRPRPEQLLSDVVARELYSGGMAYPSAHAAIATVLALLLIKYIPKQHRWLAFLGIALVALSRVYLGVHFPLDVVGGILVGGMIGALFYLPHHNKVGKPKWLYRKIDLDI